MSLAEPARSLRLADELIDPVFLLLQAMKTLDLAAGAHLLERARDRELELVEVLERLLEIVGGAGLHRLDRALDLPGSP